MLAWIHQHAVELISVWAGCSVLLSSLPTPEAFAAYYEKPKCPNWYKTIYGIGHFLAMNWARIWPGLRLLQQDKQGGTS